MLAAIGVPLVALLILRPPWRAIGRGWLLAVVLGYLVLFFGYSYAPQLLGRVGLGPGPSAPAKGE